VVKDLYAQRQELEVVVSQLTDDLSQKETERSGVGIALQQMTEKLEEQQKVNSFWFTYVISMS
jgi:hypothetical protein